jgi:hypothetical protein
LNFFNFFFFFFCPSFSLEFKKEISFYFDLAFSKK